MEENKQWLKKISTSWLIQGHLNQENAIEIVREIEKSHFDNFKTPIDFNFDYKQI